MDHHLSTAESLFPRAAKALGFGVSAALGALTLLWIWVTQPVWNYAYLWNGAHKPLAVVTVLLGAGAVLSWATAADRRRAVTVTGAVMGLVAATTVVPVVFAGHPATRWRLYAFDPTTGRLLWTRSSLAGAQVAAGPLVYAADDHWHVVAIDPTNGATRWKYPAVLAFGASEDLAGLPVGTVADHGVVAFTTDDNELHGVDAVTGAERWHRPLPSATGPSGATTTIDATQFPHAPSPAGPTPPALSPGPNIYETRSPLRRAVDGLVCISELDIGGGPGPPRVEDAIRSQDGGSAGACPLVANQSSLLPAVGGPMVHINPGQTAALPFPPYASPCGPKDRQQWEILAVRTATAQAFAKFNCLAVYDSTGARRWAASPTIPGRTRTYSSGGSFVQVLITPTAVLALASPVSQKYLGGE